MYVFWACDCPIQVFDRDIFHTRDTVEDTYFQYLAMDGLWIWDPLDVEFRVLVSRESQELFQFEMFYLF